MTQIYLQFVQWLKDWFYDKNDVDNLFNGMKPTEVYSCSSWTSYINTSASNLLRLYKMGDMYFLRYFITTNTLTYSTTDYNINDDTISSDYRPASDRTFHVATSSNHNAKIIITSGGRVKISTDTNSIAISLSGTLMYWW